MNPRIFLHGRDGTNWSIDHDRAHIAKAIRDSGLETTGWLPSADVVLVVGWHRTLRRPFGLMRRLFPRKRVIATVTNDLGVLGSAILITNNTGDVGFGNVSVQDVIGIPPVDPLDPPTAAVFVFNNINSPTDQSLISFGNLDVTSTGGVGLTMAENQNVTVGGGIIESDNGRGVEIVDNARHSITFNEISANGADYGILVQDSNGTFTVTGVNGLAGSGI